MKCDESGLVKLELPDFHPTVVQAILMVMHGMGEEALRHLTPTNLFEIAMAADFLECHDVLEGSVKRWLSCCRRWYFDEGELGLPTWQWMTIFPAFKLKGIFLSTAKFILEHGLTAL
jgi:hypothetical protein